MKYTKVDLDPTEIEKLAAFGLTNKEIASFFGISETPLYKHEEYREALDKGRSKLVISLKRKQLQVAMDGNWPALRWLGENYLGQKPAPREISGVDGQPIQIDSSGMYEKLRNLLLAEDAVVAEENNEEEENKGSD